MTRPKLSAAYLERSLRGAPALSRGQLERIARLLVPAATKEEK